MRHKLAVGLLTLALAASLIGCWDHQEITELASISGLGFDVGALPGTLRITAQISPPSPADAAGGGGGGAGGTRLRVLTIEAASLFEGITVLQGHSRREPFLRHLTFIVFGEELARAGIGDVIGGLQGIVQIRGSVPLFVSSGTAEEVLQARSGIGRIPGQDVADILANLRDAPLARRFDLNKAINTLTSLGSEVTLPILDLVPLRLEAGDEQPETGIGQGEEQLYEIVVQRLALFQRDRWIAELDAFQTQTLVLLTGEVREGSNTIANPAQPEGMMALRYTSFRARYQIEVQEQQVVLTVKPYMSTRLLEVSGSYDLHELGFEPIQEVLEQDVARKVTELFAALQELGVDSLGIGQQIHRRNPREWSRLEPIWQEVFPRMEVMVEPHAEVRSSSMIVDFFEVKRP